MPSWEKKPAPAIAKTYWGLSEDALMRDVMLAVRADEANHRDVNHCLSSLKANDTNPYALKPLPPPQTGVCHRDSSETRGTAT